MARYWVGGTASWDGTAGSKWATTDGGAGGSAIPTSADDVFFTAKPAPTWQASTAYILTNIVSPVTGNGFHYECTTAGTTGITEPTWPTVVGNTVTDGTVVWTCRSATVTIAAGNTGAKSINCTGFTRTLAGSAAISLAGSLTLVSGMTSTYSGTITFTGTGTLTSGGKSLGSIIINGSGITVTLGDAFSAGTTSSITVTQGTFDTSASNYNVTVGLLSSSNTNTRTINLNGSTLLLGGTTGVDFTTSTNLTLNAGTSQITCNRSNVIFNGGGKTFYNVTILGSYWGSYPLTGANTFNNLKIGPPTSSSSGCAYFSFSADQTINGTLTATTTDPRIRCGLFSDTLGTTRTLTVATLTATDCDFRDITIAGGAAGGSPTRAGDCGGNSGITFPAPKTVYMLNQPTFISTNAWGSSSGTGGSNNNFPLAQDTAIIDNNSAATIQYYPAIYNFGTIDCSNRTNACTLSINGPYFMYGSYILGSGMTIAGTEIQTYCGRTTQTITTAGKTWTCRINISPYLSTVQLGDAYTSSQIIALLQGTFDAKTYSVTCYSFFSNYSTTRTLTMGSGTWTLSGVGSFLWDITTTTGLTFNKDTANIVFSDTSTSARTFAGGGLTYNKLTIGGATGTSTTTFTGSNTFSELASTKTVAHTLSFTAGTTTTVGAWTITGTSGNVVTIQSATAASHTLTKTGGGTVSTDYMSISRSTATPATTWYAGTNSTNGGNNSGWIFTAPPSTATGNMFMLFQ